MHGDCHKGIGGVVFVIGYVALRIYSCQADFQLHCLLVLHPSRKLDLHARS